MNKKENPKTKVVTFRASTATLQMLELYQKESGDTRTQALEELVQLGGTVWLQKLYKGEE